VFGVLNEADTSPTDSQSSVVRFWFIFWRSEGICLFWVVGIWQFFL